MQIASKILKAADFLGFYIYICMLIVVFRSEQRLEICRYFIFILFLSWHF